MRGVLGRPSDGKFWMVWCPTARPPTKAHKSIGDALDEARRLAGECPGEVFIVLEAITAFRVQKQPVSEVSLGSIEGDEIPF